MLFQPQKKTATEIQEKLADDLNTPAALAKLHEYARMAKHGDEEAALSLIKGCELLGLDLNKQSHSAAIEEIPENVKELAEKRFAAKQNKNWSEADDLRAQLASLGYSVKDTQGGYTLTKDS